MAPIGLLTTSKNCTNHPVLPQLPRAYPAGCPTAVADPLWKSAPSASLPRAIPNGNFPEGVTFRLPTPRRVGIGVNVNEFKPPETESWLRCAAQNQHNFSRGHRYFDHYSNMQQRAHLLVPTLPLHSRKDELQRVWGEVKKREAKHEAVMKAINLNNQRRKDRLLCTRSLLLHVDAAQQVGRTLRRAYSSPEALGPAFGIHTQAMELLNRRVDVNQFRKSEKRKGPAHATKLREIVETAEGAICAVVRDIADFEYTNLPDQLDAMRSTTEWSRCKFPKPDVSAQCGLPLSEDSSTDFSSSKMGSSSVRFDLSQQMNLTSWDT